MKVEFVRKVRTSKGPIVVVWKNKYNHVYCYVLGFELYNLSRKLKSAETC